MLLNLRRDDFLLQALQNSFAFRDRQADGSGRDPVRALNRGNLVFNLFTLNHFSEQLHCPFHPSSLPHPTTLHALSPNGPFCRESLLYPRSSGPA